LLSSALLVHAPQRRGYFVQVFAIVAVGGGIGIDGLWQSDDLFWTRKF
jgi:hypothetical protein